MRNVRLAVAATPALAVRLPGHKLAALCGLLAVLVYLVLSGAHPPARRAAITASVVFLARLTDRRAVSLHALSIAALGVLALGVSGFAGLLLVASSDLTLGLIAVGGFAAAVLVFALLAWAAVLLLRRSVNETTAPRWLVLATRQISARPAYAVVQVSALSVGLLALVLLVLLRTDLIASWRQSTPPDAPNRFVINIMPDQSNAFQAALKHGARGFGEIGRLAQARRGGQI